VRRSLESLTKELCRKHGCHTLILYGSRARGDATPASDYDLIGIRTNGKAIHDTRRWNGAYLDVFVYPERRLKPGELLRVRGGRVLIEKNGMGTRLLTRIERLHARGPKPLMPEERRALRIWSRKMLERVRLAGTEGNYRRAWLLMQLLEDYFLLRGKWYPGPKEALAWLAGNEPAMHRCFDQALKPNASIRKIEGLVEKVIATPDGRA
jgi:hypothetical protein